MAFVVRILGTAIDVDRGAGAEEAIPYGAYCHDARPPRPRRVYQLRMSAFDA